MSTPGFVAQDQNSLTQVRYYTPFDPYYFSVDNRPLQDLSTNIGIISSGGGDSARRAVLLTQLALSSVFQDLFSTSNTNGLISGLTVSYPGANTLQVNPGALYKTQTLSETEGTPVIKQGLVLAAQQFTVVQPSTGGHSINYLIQGRYKDLTAVNMPSSTLPYLDENNPFLACLLLNGELELQLKNGSSAPTGSQSTPTPDPGWTPLYVATFTFGQPNPTIAISTSGPSIKGLNRDADMKALATDGATLTTIAGVPTLTLAEATSQGVSLSIPLINSRSDNGLFPNPYMPIKLKLVYSSNATGGNFAIRVKYAGLASGDSTAGSLTNSLVESVPMNVAANSINSYSTSIAVIPPSVFSGISSGLWSVTKQRLSVVLERVPSDPADTATGNMFLHDVIVYQ